MNENLRNALPHKNTPFLRVLHIIVAVLILQTARKNGRSG